MPRMVFHYPVDLRPGYVSGSTIRPAMMRQAFETLGFEVISATGASSMRSGVIADVISQLRADRRYIDFVYAEMPNVPVLLGDRKRWPPHGMPDFSFWHTARLLKIPVGVFIRDLYWRFSSYREAVSLPKRAITIPLFLNDFRQIARSASTVFLPSLRMAQYLPGSMRGLEFEELPPGCVAGHSQTHIWQEGLRLLYVGSILPPEHDITPLLCVAKELPPRLEVSLVICCYQSEMDSAKHYYQSRGISIDALPNTSFVHITGKGIEELYRNADLGVVIREDEPYLRMAMPIKVLESLGYGVPVVSNEGTPFGELLQQTGMGWAINPGRLGEFLSMVAANHAEVDCARLRIREQIHLHTWEARARHVCKILAKRAD